MGPWCAAARLRRLVAGLRRQHGISVAFERHLHQGSDGGLVFDHEQRLSCCHRRLRYLGHDVLERYPNSQGKWSASSLASTRTPLRMSLHESSNTVALLVITTRVPTTNVRTGQVPVSAIALARGTSSRPRRRPSSSSSARRRGFPTRCDAVAVSRMSSDLRTPPASGGHIADRLVCRLSNDART